MKVGDTLTEKAFRKFQDTFYETSFDGVRHTLGNDLVFEKNKDGKWELVSTRESRIAGQGNGPNVQRPERKKYKGYYNNKA